VFPDGTIIRLLPGDDARPLFEVSLDSGQADDKSAIFGLKCKSQEKCKARKRPQY
jgi:hypothetical protein